MTEIEGDERARVAGERARLTPPRVDETDTGRVLALSDGVFAIAATLLVLELRLPEGFDEPELPAKLHELLPAMGAYALSYVIIGAIWQSHHRLFKLFRTVSVRVASLNLLFLGSVSVLPFVTSLVRYDVPIAAQFYAGVVAAIFLLEAAMSGVAMHKRHIDPVMGRRYAVYAVVAALVFIVSMPLAAIPEHGPSIAKYTWLAMIPSRWVVRLVFSRRQREREHAG
jgi:uncharacterized membrane protein